MDSAEMAALATRAIATAEQVADTQKNIVRQVGRNKWLLRIALTGLVVDILLSLFAFFLYHEIRVSQLHACAAGNTLRAGQLSVWHHVLAISQAPPHETPAERKTRLAKLAAFRIYVDHQYRPLDCAKLYR